MPLSPVHTIPSSHKHARIRWRSADGTYIVVTERGLFVYRGIDRAEAWKAADRVDAEWGKG